MKSEANIIKKEHQNLESSKSTDIKSKISDKNGLHPSEHSNLTFAPVTFAQIIYHSHNLIPQIHAIQRFQTPLQDLFFTTAPVRYQIRYHLRNLDLTSHRAL